LSDNVSFSIDLEAVPAQLTSKEAVERTIDDFTNQPIEDVGQGSLASLNKLENCAFVIPNEPSQLP
jgi:hypothetical protein